jgi:hypothetical protein
MLKRRKQEITDRVDLSCRLPTSAMYVFTTINDPGQML